MVTSLHLVLGVDKRIELYSYFGEKEREWLLESTVNYIRAIGGPEGREALLVGLKNGQVFFTRTDTHTYSGSRGVCGQSLSGSSDQSVELNQMFRYKHDAQKNRCRR